MDFGKPYLVSENLELSTGKDVEAVEAKLGVELVEGYAEYMTTLGWGVYTGYIRVYKPHAIVGELKEWRKRVDEFFLWDEGKKVLPKERVVESVCFADTLDGDELIFHPSDRGAIYVLPRDFEEVFRIGKGLGEAIEWLCGSGKLTAPLKFRHFESFKNRMTLMSEAREDVDFEAVKKAVLEEGIHDHVEESDQEAFTQIFSKEFFGCIAVFGGPNYVVRIDADRGKQTAKFKAIKKRLESFGLKFSEAER